MFLLWYSYNISFLSFYFTVLNFLWSLQVFRNRKMITELKDDKMKTETAAYCYRLVIYNLHLLEPTEKTRERGTVSVHYFVVQRLPRALFFIVYFPTDKCLTRDKKKLTISKYFSGHGNANTIS